MRKLNVAAVPGPAKTVFRDETDADVDGVNTSEATDHQATMDYMSERVANIRAWLSEAHPEVAASGAYLDEGTIERAWWHRGYQTGIAEMIHRLTGKYPDE